MQTGKYLFLFYFGGSTYCTFEVFVRERSHWSMFLLGGLIFVLVGGMNQVWGWETGLIKQTAAGVGITLAGEFMTGCIKEAEGIELLYCDDLNGKDYLIYPPQYPWQITDADREMTEERLRTIYAKYVSILTDRAVAVDYQSVENGG